MARRLLAGSGPAKIRSPAKSTVVSVDLVTSTTATGDRNPALRLRPLRAGDEAAFLAAHRELAAEGHAFGFGVEPRVPWDTYLKTLDDHRHGVGMPDGWVPATFLVAEVGGEIVGRSSIRHRLNGVLEREGGHVGYAVRPGYRRRGYATEILRQSLIVARAIGIDRVLLFCDEDNIGSWAVIEACGGRLDAVTQTAPGSPRKRRYWID
jgi:predicted acetyltransferase